MLLKLEADCKEKGTENFNGLFKNYTHMKHYLKTGTVYITNNP